MIGVIIGDIVGRDLSSIIVNVDDKNACDSAKNNTLNVL